MGKREGNWLEGRDRHVRVLLTDEEHALVREAAAKADRSVSRFSIEAVVEVARQVLGKAPAAAQGERGADEQANEPAKGKKPARGKQSKRKGG